MSIERRKMKQELTRIFLLFLLVAFAFLIIFPSVPSESSSFIKNAKKVSLKEHSYMDNPLVPAKESIKGTPAKSPCIYKKTLKDYFELIKTVDGNDESSGEDDDDDVMMAFN